MRTSLIILLGLFTATVNAQWSINGGTLTVGVGPATSSGSFTATAFNFNGSSQSLTKASDITGIADGTVGTVSFWFKRGGGAGVVQEIFLNSSTHFFINIGTDNTITIRGQTTGASTCFQLHNTTAITVDGLWHHCYASWDTTSAATSDIAIDGDNTGSNHTLFTSGAIDYTDTAWYFAVYNTGNSFWYNGCIAEFWFDTTFHQSTSANVQKFRTAGGVAVDLGSDGSTPFGTVPLVYFHSTTPGNNNGSGGNFTANGSPTACGTHP